MAKRKRRRPSNVTLTLERQGEFGSLKTTSFQLRLNGRGEVFLARVRDVLKSIEKELAK